MGGSEAQGQLPASVRLAWWQREVVWGSLFSIGWLLIGAGFCCLVFSAIAFHEAGTLDKRRDMILRMAGTNQGPYVVDGRTWTATEANAANGFLRADMLEKTVIALLLLAITLGLIFGGIAVILLGCLVRPCSTAPPEKHAVS